MNPILDVKRQKQMAESTPLASVIRRVLVVIPRLGTAAAQRLRSAVLSSAWTLPGLGVLLSCSPPASTFHDVESGRVAVAAEDRRALAELVRANAMAARGLPLLLDDAVTESGTFARLQGERVVELRVDGIHDAQAAAGLRHLRHLHVEGKLVSFALRGPSALESIVLLSHSKGSLRRLSLVGLRALESVVVNGAHLAQGLELDDLPSLKDLALERCGLAQVPTLPKSPLTRLSLAGNTIQDLSPIVAAPTLVHLQLSKNGLTTPASLPPLPHLRVLNLGHNPLSPEARLAAVDFPQLKRLDLRFTGLDDVPAGLRGLPVRWDEARERQLDFHKTLAGLRQSHRDAPGELAERLPGGGGVIEQSSGRCSLKSSSFRRAEVRYDLEFGSWKG
ncbi:MAG: hypothetical protein AAFY88_22260, partial [Acidobacteriota bacterium]